jgi:glycosyltransferase involved in cell wall biosynthesis
MPVGYRGKLRWLATEGSVELTLVTMRAWAGPTGTEGFEPADEPFAIRFLEPLALASHPTLRLFAPWRLAAEIAAIRPDIVHVEAEPHSLMMGMVARLKRSGFRLVGFTWENIRRRGRFPLSLTERYGIGKLSHLVAGNREAVEVMRWRGYDGPATVIPQWGFDPARFAGSLAPSPALHASAGLRIGYVGRLVEEKGLEELLRACAGLSAPYALTLIGRGPLAEPLRALAASLGLGSRVHWIGGVAHGEIPTYLRNLDVLVLPSRTLPWWKEQFGRVLVEAMLSGIAVVGSDSGAIPEVIGDGGLIYPEGEPQALRACLERLASDPAERLGLAQAGRARALALYTDEAIGRATLAVYQSVLAG